MATDTHSLQGLESLKMFSNYSGEKDIHILQQRPLTFQSRNTRHWDTGTWIVWEDQNVFLKAIFSAKKTETKEDMSKKKGGCTGW